MDFIIRLFMSEKKNIIFIIINCLTKKKHYIPYLSINKRISALEIIWLFIHKIYKLYKLPNIAILNYNKQFISYFWRILCQLFNIKIHLFIAYYL